LTTCLGSENKKSSIRWTNSLANPSFNTLYGNSST
jgi:hypothetical protein